MATFQIPSYSVGTVAIAAKAGNVYPVTGVGTNWTSTDGTANWPVTAGEWIVCGNAFGIVDSIVDSTHLNLSVWTGGVVSAGASYQIFRFVPTPESAVMGLLQALLALMGSSGVRFTPDGGGNMLLQVLSGSSVWQTAATMSIATGQFSINNAPTSPTGFRNRVRNPQFLVNQRAVSGTVTLAAGVYGHDGVRAGSGGATYTFAQTGTDVTLTVTAGSIILPIEGSFIEGGTFYLSHSGSAQARVWQGTGYTGSGSYSAAPFSVGMTANLQTNVEFSTGTVLRPQFESGGYTAFERRPLSYEVALCQRYYDNSYPPGVPVGTASATAYACATTDSGLYTFMATIDFKTTMRVAPTVHLYSYNSGAVDKVYYAGSSSDVSVSGIFSIGPDGFSNIGLSTPLGGMIRCFFHWTASAEL